MSSQYIVDGEEAKNFIKECAPLWKKAGEILQVVFRKTYKIYTNYPLPDGLTRLAEAWMGMAVNEGCKEDPVVSDKHQDRNDAFYGVSCVCAFGDYKIRVFLCSACCFGIHTISPHPFVAQLCGYGVLHHE